MFCCPVRVKCRREVGKRGSSDREDYYFDCEEPSSDDESCVHVSESRTLKGTRSYLLPFLALILPCFATLVRMMGRTSGNTTEEIAAATAAQTSASGEAAPEPPNVTDEDMGVAAPEISGSDEQAPFHYSEQTVGDTECTIFSHAGHLWWYYKDYGGKEYGPYEGDIMADWWKRDCFGGLKGELLVRLKSWKEFVPLKVLYPLASTSFEGPPRAPAWAGYEQHGPNPELQEHRWTEGPVRDDPQPEPAGPPTARAPESPKTLTDTT